MRYICGSLYSQHCQLATLRYPAQRSSATQFQARIRECRDRNLRIVVGDPITQRNNRFIDVGVIRRSGKGSNNEPAKQYMIIDSHQP